MLSVWNLPPDYIVEHWSRELLNLMSGKLSERKQRDFEVVQGKVSDKELFSKMGGKVKYIQKG